MEKGVNTKDGHEKNSLRVILAISNYESIVITSKMISFEPSRFFIQLLCLEKIHIFQKSAHFFRRVKSDCEKIILLVYFYKKKILFLKISVSKA